MSSTVRLQHLRGGGNGTGERERAPAPAQRRTLAGDRWHAGRSVQQIGQRQAGALDGTCIADAPDRHAAVVPGCVKVDCAHSRDQEKFEAKR